MYIHVKLYATLSPNSPKEPNGCHLNGGARVKDLIEHLGIRPEDAKLIFVNSRRADMDTPLSDQDRVGIFPPVGGG